MTDLTDEIGRQSQKVSVVHMAELPTVFFFPNFRW